MPDDEGVELRTRWASASSHGGPACRPGRSGSTTGSALPARVDELSGFCYDGRGQLDRARLIATLRHVGVPLAIVKEWLALDAAEIAEKVTGFWHEAETRHTGQRELVTALVDRLTGRSTAMYELLTREMPERPCSA